MLGRRSGAARGIALAACALLFFAATAAYAADAPPETGDPVEGFPGETERDPHARETRKQQRARRSAFVDDCDACAAAGYAVHDALAYQQARMRAKLGGDARLAEVTDRGEYAAAAVASACDSRGHWLRYAMRGVFDPETSSSSFLVLSGPGMDSDAAPGLTRPDDRRGTLELSEALRAQCVEETARVGEAFLLAAFNDTDAGAFSSTRAERAGDDDDDDADGSYVVDIDRKEEHAAAFAYALCVDEKRAKKAGAPKPPCLETTVRRRAGAVIAAAAREAETVRSLSSAFGVPEGEREREREREDRGGVADGGDVGDARHANDADPLSALLRRCADRRAEFEDVTRAAATAGAASRLDPDVGLGEADAAFARRCLSASSAATARGDAFARAASTALTGGSIGGGSIGGHSGGSAQGTTADARRARFEARLASALAAYAAAEAAAPRGSPEAAAAATRAARALVAEHPGFDGGRLAGALERDVGEEEDPLPLRDGDENKDEENKDEKKNASFSSRFGYDAVAFSSHESRLRVAVSAAWRASAARRFDPAARLALADLLAASGDSEAAFDEYAEALYYLPYHGEIAAAATTRAGAAAAAAAHRLAGFCRTMTEALEETGTLSRGDEAAEADGGDEERPRVTPERVEEIASGLRRAAEMAEARAKEAAMNHLEALVMSPSRRRHASFATATLAHAAVVDARYADALNAAAIVDRCDEKRPPRECHAVYLSHARGLMDMRLWALAREAAHLAVSARGEKGRETRAAWAVAAEAERRMDVVADEAFMEKTLGKDWRGILRGDPEKDEL